MGYVIGILVAVAILYFAFFRKTKAVNQIVDPPVPVQTNPPVKGAGKTQLP